MKRLRCYDVNSFHHNRKDWATFYIQLSKIYLEKINFQIPCESLCVYILCHCLKLKCVLVCELLAYNMATGFVDFIRIVIIPYNANMYPH